MTFELKTRMTIQRRLQLSHWPDGLALYPCLPDNFRDCDPLSGALDPELSRWLSAKGRQQETLDVLVASKGKGTEISEVQAAFRQESVTASTIRVDAEHKMMKFSIVAERSKHTRRNTMPKFPLLVGIETQAMQQLTGINLICYYLPYVPTESGGQEGATALLVLPSMPCRI